MAKFKVGDKVRILDGSNIKNYSGTWCPESMKKFVGEVDVIKKVIVNCNCNGNVGYYMEHNDFIWDERGLELVEVPQKIVITTDGKRTTAVLYDGKKRIDEASAVCSDDDEFNFMTGAKIAFERLTEEKEPERDLRELLKDGVFGKEQPSGLFVVEGDQMNNNSIIMVPVSELKALMMETVFEMCAEDAQDAAAYVYAYDRLMEAIMENEEKRRGEYDTLTV